MSAPVIGSLLIGSSRPDDLKAWYRRAFDVEENEMGALAFSGLQLFVETHSEVSGRNEDPARMIVNVDVDDARSYARHLKDMGATFVRPLEQEAFGLIATVADPDGNYVQVIQWGATPEAHLE